MAMIRLEKIYKKFEEKYILENLNIKIDDKKLISLIGPSGAGKTTILKIISGILKQDSGNIYIDDKEISNISPEKRNIVIVFQDYLLFPHMNVFDNISFGLRMRGRDRVEIKNIVNKLLDMIKLNSYIYSYPNELSGGQKQRVALARALAINPKILLLDEPFAGLDPLLRAETRNLIKDLQRQTGTTTILVTHDKEEAMIVSDKIALILDRKIEQYDKAEDIYLNPVSKKAADFFGETNYLKGIVKSGYFKNDYFNFKVKYSDCENALMMIRPENIIPNKEGINAEILDKEYRGDRSLYKIKVGKDKLLMLTSPYDNFSIGDNIKISLKQKNNIIFCN